MSPQRFTNQLFLVLNVTGALGLLEVSNPFYAWGYATPFHHTLSASRYLLYGSGFHIGLHLGVLVAMFFMTWGGMLLVLYMQYKLGWFQKREKKKEVETTSVEM
jgi:hypothetical protein